MHCSASKALSSRIVFFLLVCANLSASSIEADLLLSVACEEYTGVWRAATVVALRFKRAIYCISLLLLPKNLALHIMASAPYPLPSAPPPASQLQRYSFDPPDFVCMHRCYHADEAAQNLVFDAWEAGAASHKYSLCVEALRRFPWSVDAYNALGDLFRRECKQIDRAVICYRYAEQCGNLVWPELREEGQNEEGGEIPWGVPDKRPYLRTYHGLAVCLLEQGDVDTAIEKLKFLLRVDPNDNQGCRYILFQALIDKADYKEAEEVAAKFSNGRKSRDCNFRYGFVLMDFVTKSDQLEETLVKALQRNNMVPQLLLEERPLPPQPDTVGHQTIDEAADYVRAAMNSWRRLPGVLDWL